MDNLPTQNGTSSATPVATPQPSPTPLPNIPPMPAATKNFSKILEIFLIGLLVIICAVLVFTGYQLLRLSGTAKNSNNAIKNGQNLSTTNGASVAGTIGLDGLPPQGSYINVLARKVGTKNYSVVAASVAAVDGATWAWNNAEVGVAYEVKAQIIGPKGNDEGDSSILTVAAPAQEEVINVNLNPAALPTPTPLPTNAPTPTPILSSISGTFDLNGYIPSGTTITVSARAVGAQNFTTVATNLPAVDNASWNWTNAIQNTSYEIQAVMNDGNNDQSQVISVTAPATSEILTINSTVSSPQATVTGISGTINLNGNIPSGAYITLGTRVTGTGSFNQVASNIAASNGVAWSWGNATAGTSYDLQAYLWINGQPASQSQILTVDAPATGEVLTINAQTQGSAPNGNTISASCSNNGNGEQATVNFNVGNTLNNAQQYQLYIGTTGGGNQIINNTISPSNPSQQQSYTTSASLNQGQTYYTQYAYSTCANCNTFSAFSPSISFTCN